jgi:HK97 family phage major capsid protein
LLNQTIISLFKNKEMFKLLSKEQFDALTPEQQSYYMEQKALHDKGELDKTVKGLVDGQVASVKENLEKEIEAQKEEVSKVTVKLDEAQKEIDQLKADASRIRVAANENEAKGRAFDIALDEAMKENADELKELSKDKNAKVRLQLKAVGTMGISSVSGIDLANAQLRPGIVPIPNRRLHMRDIMNTGRMTTSDFHYLRETGGEGDVGVWAENSGNKPQLDFDYIESVAPSQYIAGFLQISRKALDDIPAMRSALSMRLLEKYLVAEDAQILNGTGTGSQLEGILQVAEAYDGAKDRLIERVVDAIGQLEENNHYADGIVLKPRDWSEIALTVGNTQEFTLPGVGVVNVTNGVMYINGVPIYKINGMPSNDRQFLVGDWMLGSQLLIREDPIVEFSYENATNFQRNEVTVRVEGRVALPIYYDDAYVKGDTNTPTT